MTYSDRQSTFQSAGVSKVIPGLNYQPSIVTGVEAEDVHFARYSARAHLAKMFYDARRSREKFFTSTLFADPAWDIMLILYWSGYIQQRMKTGAVCAAAAIPATTGLRWIGQLRGIGLLYQESHPTDCRVKWVELSYDAHVMLDQYFDGLLAKQLQGSRTKRSGLRG